MKALVSRPELASLISKIQGVVSAKPAIPILSNVLIEAYDDQLTLSATDLTVSIRASIDAKVEQEGAITLPAKRFFQLIRELTCNQIELECSTGEIAFIKADSSKFRLNGMHKSEFPSLPDFTGAKPIDLSSDVFKSMLSKTVFAAARDDSRHVLNGVMMKIVDEHATFVGTDGKRLAKIYTEVEIPEMDGLEYLLPLKAVEEMVKLVGLEEEIHLLLDHDKIALDVGPISLMTKLLAGQYPDVERVIPEKSELRVSLHREELMTLLKQVSLFTTDRTNSVHFVFNKGELHLMATSSEIGEGKVSMPVDYDGEKMEIAFNPSYFLDILRHSDDETVTFGITDSYNPGLITDSSTALFVIMPMRLNHA